MLSHGFEFYSLDDGLFLRKLDVFHSKAWKVCLWFNRAFKLRILRVKHVCTFYGLPLDKNVL